MTNRKCQKLLSFAIAILTAVSALIQHDDAKAGALAYLVSCNSTTSVTGQFMYVGVYSYAGRQFTQGFRSYCPQSIEIQ